MTQRFERVTQIPGTRYVMNSPQKISALLRWQKQVRAKNHLMFITLKIKQKKNSAIQVLDYVSCLYDNKWWLGIITNADKEEDVQMKFMHLSGPSRCFQ